MKKQIFLLIGIICIVFNTNAQWQQTNGPEGGRFISFASNDSLIFAGTFGGGVYKSADNGEHWQSINGNMNFPYITTLTIRNNILFAGTYEGGILRSSDYGITWTTVNTGLSNLKVNCLATNDTCIYAGTEGGFFVSYNDGTNWNESSTGLTNLYVYSLWILNNTIFAGTIGGGVCKTETNNLLWTSCGFAGQNVGCVIGKDSTIYAGLNSGIYTSHDGGNIWTSLTGINLPVTSIGLIGSKIFVATTQGFSVTTDNGITWTSHNTGLGDFDIYSMIILGNDVLLGTVKSGVYKADTNTYI